MFEKVVNLIKKIHMGKKYFIGLKTKSKMQSTTLFAYTSHFLTFYSFYQHIAKRAQSNLSTSSWAQHISQRTGSI